jgi:hypothetical protein
MLLSFAHWLEQSRQMILNRKDELRKYMSGSLANSKKPVKMMRSRPASVPIPSGLRDAQCF